MLRGLHYQIAPHAQGKLVRVVRGAIADVFVDIRRGSPTLGAWDKVVLSAETPQLLWLPEGFAHGFLALSDNTGVCYMVSALYEPRAERCIRWDDPALGIAWGNEEPPSISDKDLAGGTFADAELFER